MNGERPLPDELAEIVTNLIAPLGKLPSKWSQKEYERAVKDHMKRLPCLLATKGEFGFTAEFPCGESSSLFRAMGREPHPRYGNGLLLTQSFRTGDLSEEKAIRFALSLNTSELTKSPTGYGSAAIATMPDAHILQLLCPMQSTDQDCFPVFITQPQVAPWQCRRYSRTLTGTIVRRRVARQYKEQARRAGKR